MLENRHLRRVACRGTLVRGVSCAHGSQVCGPCAKTNPGNRIHDNPKSCRKVTKRKDTFASLVWRPHFELIVMLLLGAIALACAWIYRDYAQDDAFITYRYAANLANGFGFVYNRGEPLLGTSTPLYAIILAVLARVSGLEVRVVGHLVSVISLWVSGVLLYSLGKAYARLEAAAVAIVFISNALLLSAIGMETLFLLALLLFSLKLYLAERLYLTGFVLGLLIVTRYEAILFAALLGFHFILRQRRMPIWLVFALPPFLLWAIYAWRAFGNIIPNSAAAKLVERGASHGISFATGAILWWRIYSFESNYYYVLLPIVLLGGYAGLRNKIHHRPYMLLVSWSVVYFAAASSVALSFSWYYGPLIPGFAILVTWGAEFLAVFCSVLSQKLLKTQTRRRAIQLGTLILLVLAIVALQISSWASHWVSTGDRVIDGRYPYYREIAQWLNDHGNEQQTIATHEIGVLGYYTDMRVIDFHGLVTPGLVPWLPHGGMEPLVKAIEIYSPDFILTPVPDYMEYIENLGDYELTEVFADRTYALYRKKPSPSPSGTRLAGSEGHQRHLA